MTTEQNEMICNHCKHTAHCGQSCLDESCDHCSECACNYCQAENEQDLTHN
jgi:hypothetical protein